MPRLRYADPVEFSQIAIVHHRTPDVLGRALDRLARFAPDVPVTILDTTPDPASLPDLRDLARRRHPCARVAPQRNHSYADAVNRALREAPGPLVATMNADVFVGPDTLRALAAPFADPRVALAGPLARTADGRLQDQGPAYRLRTARLEGTGPHATLDVPWLSGCLLAVRVAAARDAGGMDASLRFFNEDLEWGRRLRGRGWRVVLVGDEVVHLGGSATPDAAPFRLEGLRGGMATARRHDPPWRRGAQRLAVGAWAATRVVAGPAERRDEWRAVAAMMARARFDESPFGATLAEANPAFGPREERRAA